MDDDPAARRSSSAKDEETRAVSAPHGPRGLPGASSGVPLSRYVALEEVGRGAMGRVLRAYDPKLQREVALKEVRRDALDDEATVRLIAEARAMAKLSHPHVVAVFDVEEAIDGRVVLVMEYVAGTTLKRWLRAGDRGWREIVERFIQAGQGLRAAHEAGLLHRDFKPANVLVGENASVKVTDFGLAKVSSRAPSESAADVASSADDLTQTGTVIGSPRYMAPEQHRGETLSAAADQYAFCVALWEALTQAPPFAGDRMASAKSEGPPPWPKPEIPQPIVKTIVRGLSPRPRDRWPSMGALLDALVWDPVARRKRALLGFAGLAALGAVGVSYGVWADARAQRCGGATTKLAGIWNEGTRARVRSAFEAVETAYASRAWTRTEAALDVYADEWSAMYTEACEATTVRGEQSPATMDLRMACLQSAVVELNAAVEVLADADAAVVQQAHEVTGGLPPVDRCADTKALGADVEPPLEHEAEAVDKARAHLARARSLIEVGRLAPAGLAVQAAKDSLTDVEYEPVQAEIALVEGNVLEGLGNYEAAEAVLDESLRLATKWMRRELMQQAASHLMFVVGFQQRRTADALALRSLAAGLSEGDPMAEAHFRNSLSNILSAQGKYAESETECRAALALVESTLGPKSLDAATARDNLGAVLGHQGKHAAAEAEHRAALDVMVALLGHDHPSVAQSRNNLAAALFSQGKNAEAEREFRATVSAAEVLLGGQHPHVASTRNNLGAVLLAQGKYAEAEAEFRAALAIRVAALGHGHPAIAQSRNNLASSLADQGKFDEAETIHRATLAEREASLGHDHPDVAVSRNNLGNLLQRQGRYAEAESEFRSALGVREAVLGPEHPDVAQSAYNLATVVVQLERDIEALPLAEQAWTRRQRDDIPQRQRADSAFLLARLLWTIEGRARDRPRARQLAKDAVRWYEQGGERDRSKLADAEKWLEENMP